MARLKKPAHSYHHGNLRAALIEAATSLAAKKGADKLSLRDVAKKAGVSNAAPYRHFANKDALLMAIAEQGFGRLRAYLEEAIKAHPTNPAAQFTASGWQYIRFALENPEHFKIMFSSDLPKGGPMEGAEPNEELEGVGTDAYQVLREIIITCQNAGVMRKEPVDNLALTAWSLVHGFAWLQIERELVAPSAAEQISIMMTGLLYEGVRPSQNSGDGTETPAG